MSLCDGCRSGLSYERANGERTYLCYYGDARPVPGDIVRCSRFENRSTPAIYELKEVAWSLQVGRNGSVKGFQPPKEDDK